MSLALRFVTESYQAYPAALNFADGHDEVDVSLGIRPIEHDFELR